jgi:hypothetical protein
MIDSAALLISCLLVIYVAYRAMRLDALDRPRRSKLGNLSDNRVSIQSAASEKVDRT